ncbi:MAG: hypothetical protein WBX25_03745, partial [Rhodomicrobium sp.]
MLVSAVAALGMMSASGTAPAGTFSGPAGDGGSPNAGGSVVLVAQHGVGGIGGHAGPSGGVHGNFSSGIGRQGFSGRMGSASHNFRGGRIGGHTYAGGHRRGYWRNGHWYAGPIIGGWYEGGSCYWNCRSEGFGPA